MRELVIRNLTLIVDARDGNAVLEAERVIEWANEALDDNDGGPTLYFSLDDNTATAEYRENGDED
jgi:hypothetical protein